ncbi:MAG: tetratricopeptide repeat protein [Okeania sp. SIO3B5]|uniref:tetratricopeptide repeat protein n=1 Tax=Okeania sp. SIO3B5 TaxID=2607811 RepID=UPI001400818C|nr:tetratricopeptide repeat protein [Okeania sp. SIO3B5]NEO57146.1 tetratricopeptide repeat protein [Okeania sp. SIO3B5]
MFLNAKNILLIFQQSLILFTYFLIFSKSVIAEPSKNNVLPINKQQFVNQAENFAQQRIIPSQLKAIRKWEEELLKWQTLGDKSQAALTLIKLGEIYKDIGATKLALEHYNKALSLYREFDNRLQEAFILSQISSIYIIELERLKEERNFHSLHSLYVNSRQSQLLLEKIRSTPEKVLELYQKSLRIYQELNNLSGEASILNKMAQKRYLYDSDLDKHKLLQKSLAIYQEIGDKQGEALVLGFLSEFNLMEYRNDQAGWDLFDRAMAIYGEITPQNSDGFTIGKAQANLLTMAVDYWWSDNQRKALELYEQSLKIYQEIGDKKGEALAIKNMGYRYFLLEDKEKELEFYTEALGIYREIGDSFGIANILDSLGRAYYFSGDVEKALEFYNQELEILQEASQFYSQIGDSETALIFEYRQPVIWFAIGNIYSKLQDDKNEIEAYKQARKVYQELRDNEGEIDFLIKVAEYYGNQENLEKMVEFLTQAVKIYQEKGDFQAEANLLRDKIAGIYFYRLKDSETGFEILNKSLKIYRQIGKTEEVAKTLSRIGYLYLYTAENELQNPLESKRMSKRERFF